jgi:diguanylate cyclase (GGDEF)-like protein
MRQVTRRQWWLWSSGAMVTMLLTVGIASFAFPGLLSQQGSAYFYNLDLVVRGLVGLVLLFNIYVIYQQLQIHRIQLQVDTQIGALDRLGQVEERTEQVYKIAGLDSLTDLYNRRLGEQRLMEEMSRAQRHARPLTAMRLDLNGLEAINNTFGHSSGDHTIRYFAEGLQTALRSSDVLVRLGSNEFLVLLPECGLSEVELVLNRLNYMTEEFGSQQIPLKFAAGWTDYVPGESSRALMMRAESALRLNSAKEKLSTQVAHPGALPNGKSGSGSPKNNSAVSTLKPREREVLQLLAQGNSNKVVASSLGLSVRTVETYRASIMAQLNVHSVAELILYAIRNNVIAIDRSGKD